MRMINVRKLLLLGLLRHTDMHGYMLNAHLDATVPLTIKKPTAYNLLEIMEKDGWVKHRNEHVGDRAKKVYSLTKDGENMFFHLLKQQLSTFIPGEHPGLVSIGFLDALPGTEALELLRERKKQLNNYLALFNKTDDGNRCQDNHHHGSTHLVLQYTQRSLKSEMKFLDEVITALENL